jgi:hypothetical protein
MIEDAVVMMNGKGESMIPIHSIFDGSLTEESTTLIQLRWQWKKLK